MTPNIFQADDGDAFDSYVDDEPTAQTMFMAHLSSAAPSSQPSGSSTTPAISEVPIPLSMCNVVDAPEVHNVVQPTDISASNTAYMGNSNVIPYEQDVRHNIMSVVPNHAPSLADNDCDLHEHTVYIPDDTLTTRLHILKD